MFVLLILVFHPAKLPLYSNNAFISRDFPSSLPTNPLEKGDG